MANQVVGMALEKISKKYPNFCADSGKKVVDSLQDAYKTIKKNKSKLNADSEKSGTEGHALIEIPSESAGGQVPGTTTATATASSSNDSLKRESVYDSCDDFLDAMDHTEAQNSGMLAKDSRYSSYQMLSDNPPTLSMTGSEKNVIGGEY